MNIGIWSGWAEPVREHDPLDDAAACPTCGFSPQLAATKQHGMLFFFVSCCTHETTPRLVRDAAVREWNEMCSEMEAEYCERWSIALLKTGRRDRADAWLQMALQARIGE